MNRKRPNAAKERREKAAATASATNGVYRYHGKSLRLHKNRLKTSCPILAHWQLQELRTFYTLYFWAPPSTVSSVVPPLHYFMEPPPSTPNHDTYLYTNSSSFQHEYPSGVECHCAPVSNDFIILMYFFTIEWILCVVCFEPSSQQHPDLSFFTKMKLWFQYLLGPSTIIDALATIPYSIERYERINGIISLCLLRLFRIFQIVQLGQYNANFNRCRLHF